MKPTKLNRAQASKVREVSLQYLTADVRDNPEFWLTRCRGAARGDLQTSPEFWAQKISARWRLIERLEYLDLDNRSKGSEQGVLDALGFDPRTGDVDLLAVKLPPLFTVHHSHRHGDSVYLLASQSEPDKAEAVAALDLDYEPNRDDEFIDISRVELPAAYASHIKALKARIVALEAKLKGAR